LLVERLFFAFIVLNLATFIAVFGVWCVEFFYPDQLKGAPRTVSGDIIKTLVGATVVQLGTLAVGVGLALLRGGRRGRESG